MQKAGMFIEELKHSIRDEARVGWEEVRKRWSRSIGERVESGRAIGPLELRGTEPAGPLMLWHFEASVEDMSLFREGERVLVTAFTHRAIHHALRMIRKRVDCPVFKVSDPFPHDAEGIEFRDNFRMTGLIDHPGPYVLGITPISLFTSRTADARFDSAVIDETSQMKVEAAMMPMLRAQRWFFFGDDKQLPPVVQRSVEDPASESVFVALKRGDNSTMLRESYRLNDLLVRWPSESFYGGVLEAHEANAGHRFALKQVVGLKSLLGAEPAMVGVEIDHAGCRARSDEEAEVVTEVVRAMLAGGLPGGEIGVVVPFRAQAAKLRRMFMSGRFKELPGVADVVVDTVERFQGQEREAMVVSFAVSDPEFMDRLRSFLLFPQRLNVPDEAQLADVPEVGEPPVEITVPECLGQGGGVARAGSIGGERGDHGEVSREVGTELSCNQNMTEVLIYNHFRSFISVFGLGDG